jgi:hypothetical protein
MPACASSADRARLAEASTNCQRLAAAGSRISALIPNSRRRETSRLEIQERMALRALVAQPQAEVDACRGVDQPHVAEALGEVAE